MESGGCGPLYGEWWMWSPVIWRVVDVVRYMESGGCGPLYGEWWMWSVIWRVVDVVRYMESGGCAAMDTSPLQDIHLYRDHCNDTGDELNDTSCDNSTSEYSDVSFEDPFRNPWFKCAFILLYSVVFFVCCFGNSVVLYTIARNKRMRTRTNFFLANLAVADLGVGTVCILPKLIQYLSSRWLLGEVMCKISYFAQNMTYTASILLLTVIAIERYIAVLHPLRSKCIVTETRLVISQVIIWVVSAAYNSPDLHMFALFHAHDPPNNVTATFCLPLHPHTNMKHFYMVNFVVWYILPLGQAVVSELPECLASQAYVQPRVNA
ncbi:hypothetical protein Btru_072362 [Bulinus truncatus]|nr:hypothetical protein Btru_072362 [Bulinus truncatus]